MILICYLYTCQHKLISNKELLMYICYDLPKKVYLKLQLTTL